MAQMKRKKRENYFQQQINQNGPEFLENMPLDKLRSDTVRVFRDLARGNIDIEIYGKYFYNERFLETCISVAETKWNFHLVSANGVQKLLESGAQGQFINDVYEHHIKVSNAYGLIRSKLVEFREYKNTNSLIDLIFNLGKFRYYV